MDTQKNKQNSPIQDNNEVAVDLVADEHMAKLAANLLNDHAQHLDAKTLQGLSKARELAVGKLAASQSVQQTGHVLQWLGAGYFAKHRLMAAAIVVIAMLLTFLSAQKFNVDNNLENSDAFLLASELPPEAFADKGFDTWLVSQRD